MAVNNFYAWNGGIPDATIPGLVPVDWRQMSWVAAAAPLLEMTPPFVRAQLLAWRADVDSSWTARTATPLEGHAATASVEYFLPLVSLVASVGLFAVVVVVVVLVARRGRTRIGHCPVLMVLLVVGPAGSPLVGNAPLFLGPWYRSHSGYFSILSFEQ